MTLGQPKKPRQPAVSEYRQIPFDIYHGKPCPKCGGTQRYGASRHCVSCKRKLSAAYKREVPTAISGDKFAGARFPTWDSKKSPAQGGAGNDQNSGESQG